MRQRRRQERCLRADAEGNEGGNGGGKGEGSRYNMTRWSGEGEGEGEGKKVGEKGKTIKMMRGWLGGLVQCQWILFPIS